MTACMQLACREQVTIFDGITIWFGSILWYAYFKSRTWFCEFLVALIIKNPRQLSLTLGLSGFDRCFDTRNIGIKSLSTIGCVPLSFCIIGQDVFCIRNVSCLWVGHCVGREGSFCSIAWHRLLDFGYL